jgi:F0F1-type ATP synthase assembly protein I
VGKSKRPFSALVGEYTSLAFMMPTATFIGYLIGYLIDKWLGTHWVYIPGLLVGIAAGLVELIRYLQRDTRDDDPS